MKDFRRVSWTARKKQRMDSGKSWSKTNFVSKCKDKEIALFWSPHDTQSFGTGYHLKNLIRKEEKRKTKDMVRQHHSVDIYGLKRVLRVMDNRSH